MFKKLQVAAVLLCMLSYASAGPVSIGTASARGDMRIDSYMVKGNATLFDGSVVETGQATADLRLGKGTEITMSTSSRGTLYFDRLVLQQGASELEASNSFQVEANGLRVTPKEPNSRGVVSMKTGNTVEVAALNGSFGVTNPDGVMIANVRPGVPVSFAIQTASDPAQAGGGPTSFSGVGLISFEDGHYYFTSSTDVKYEVVGKDFKKYVGAKVVISGTLESNGTPTVNATSVSPVVSVKSIAINGAGRSKGAIFLISGVVVAAGVGAGVGIYEYNKASPAASQ